MQDTSVGILILLAGLAAVSLLMLWRRRPAAAVEAPREAQERRAGQILDSIADGFVALDRSWSIIYLNPLVERLFGRPRDELLGTDVRDILPDIDRNVFWQHYQQAVEEGSPIHFEARSHLVDSWFEVHAYPSASGLSVLFRDVTERRQNEERLRSLSMLDELTGLYNRRGFHTLAQQQVRHAHRKKRPLLLFFLDLDGLKEINDGHGHAVGDQALVHFAEALRQTFRESDILARLGGDEFAVMALETDSEAAPNLLARLQHSLEERRAAADFPVPLSVSAGTAEFTPRSPAAVEDLLALADRRMYQSKRERESRAM